MASGSASCSESHVFCPPIHRLPIHPSTAHYFSPLSFGLISPLPYTIKLLHQQKVVIIIN